MSHPRQAQATHRLMEDLLDCPSPQQRCSMLLDTLLREKLCESVALWRRVGSGKVRAWHPMLARGSASLLPTLEMVRAVAAGDLPQELSGGRAVILPVNHRKYALAVGQGHMGDEDREEDLNMIDALFHVWMAVEIAESVNQSDSLLDVMPSLVDVPARSGSPSPMFWHGWTRFVENEADRQLDPSAKLEVTCDELPTEGFDEPLLRTLVRELVTHGAAGFERAPRRLSVALEHLPERGIRVVVEEDGGLAPSLRGQPTGRFSSGLFDASEMLHAAGGDFSIEVDPRGSTRVLAFLPFGA